MQALNERKTFQIAMLNLLPALLNAGRTHCPRSLTTHDTTSALLAGPVSAERVPLIVTRLRRLLLKAAQKSR